MMKNKLVPIALTLALVGFVAASTASAQTALNNRTVLTFSQPVEVPGKVLPAGTYTFELNDSMANRHIVQIMDAKGTKVVALVLAVPNRRLTATGDTTVNFAEVAAGQPQALRAWFYPGQTVGQEMVYPKKRAQELAATANVAVPSVDDSFYDNATADRMKTANVTPASPDQQIGIAPVAPAQPPATQPLTPPIAVDPATPRTVTPAPGTAPAPVPPPAPVAATPREELPSTASPLPMIALFGVVTLGLGLALRGIPNRRSAR
jgi:hypothetical protein